MTAIPATLANGASGIYLFNGYDLESAPQEEAVISALKKLERGEILRLFIEKSPLMLLRALVIQFGSKVNFQYFKNQEGLVIIDFKKVRE
jgi:uncharacterized protein (DUF2249 family)